ncbi:hypothetical protein HMI54_008856, partial [Coelomomyces lativittatus]
FKDESIATISNNYLNPSLENYNKLFSKEQKQDFVQFLQETLFRSYRLYRLAFNIDIKNNLPTPLKNEYEKQVVSNPDGLMMLDAEQECV